MKNRFNALLLVLLAAGTASAQVVTGVFASGTLQTSASTGVWYQARVWSGGSGRGGGHGHWVTIWRTRAIESAQRSAPLGLNSTVNQFGVMGKAIPGYGSTMAAGCAYWDNGLAANFVLNVKDVSTFNPLLGTYNNASLETGVKYVLSFNAAGPVNVEMHSAGPVSVEIMGQNADAPVYPMNGVLSTVLDPDYYTMTVTAGNSEFADKYKNQVSSYGPLDQSFNLRMQLTLGNN